MLFNYKSYHKYHIEMFCEKLHHKECTLSDD